MALIEASESVIGKDKPFSRVRQGRIVDENRQPVAGLPRCARNDTVNGCHCERRSNPAAAAYFFRYAQKVGDGWSADSHRRTIGLPGRDELAMSVGP